MSNYDATEGRKPSYEYLTVQSSVEAVQVLKIDVEKWAKKSITKNGVFRIAVDGGSNINHVCDMLLDPRQNTDLSKWKIFLCDERYVPETDENSNFGQYKARLNVPNSPIKLEQIFSINTELPIKEAAKDYEKRIRTEFGVTSDEIPKFDYLILGIGHRGNICSLFRKQKLLKETKKLVSSLTNAPTPPPKRITMTLPLLNNATALCVIGMGVAKYTEISRYILTDMSLPISRVRIKNIIRIFDKESAFLINEILKNDGYGTPDNSVPDAPSLDYAFSCVLYKAKESSPSEESSEASTPEDSSKASTRRIADNATVEEESHNPQPSTSAAAVKKVGNKETDKSETSSTSTAADKGIEDNPESSSTSTVAKGPEDNPQSVSSISSEAKATEEKNDSSSSDDE